MVRGDFAAQNGADPAWVNKSVACGEKVPASPG
jgi:hypothetical protein